MLLQQDNRQKQFEEESLLIKQKEQEALALKQ